MPIGRTGLLFIVFGVVAVGLPPIGLWIDGRAEDDYSDAREAQRELALAALGAINAETGMRGFILNGDDEFRTPYDAGVRQFTESTSRLEPLVDGDRLEAALTDLQRAFANWRATSAEPHIALAAAGDLERARTPTELANARILFNEVRASLDLLGIRLDEAVEDAETDREQAGTLQFLLMVCAALGLAGVVAMTSVLLTSRHRSQVELRLARGLLESEQEISGRRGEIIATASHELRNPLTGLLLSAQILEEESVETGNSELAMMASEVALSARRAADLVTELLDFTRLEAGRLELADDSISPEAFVDSAVRDVQMSHADTTIEIEPEAPDDVRIRGDYARLRMVVRNLLENACRYGEPPLRVRITNGGGDVEIHVEDSGPGIPTAERAAVFNRFQRGTTATGRDGTGLGLYISKGIVELHGGSIRVATSPLGGADFVVALPRN